MSKLSNEAEQWAIFAQEIVEQHGGWPWDRLTKAQKEMSITVMSQLLSALRPQSGKSAEELALIAWDATKVSCGRRQWLKRVADSLRPHIGQMEEAQ